MSEAATQAKALAVEIAGVAGAGKSTLASLLTERGFGVLDDTLRVREPRHLGMITRSVWGIAGLSRQWIATRRLPNWTELKLIIYLMEWDKRLTPTKNPEATVMLLDQGPVYALARLGHIRPMIAGTEPHGDWWSARIDAWADCLDVVIWLDAPNDTLRGRVNTRSQEHQIKGAPGAEASDYVERYRASYEQVLAAIERPGGPLVLRYDTGRLRAAEIADDTIDKLARMSPDPGAQPRKGGPT